jgi:hypothetical protein
MRWNRNPGVLETFEDVIKTLRDRYMYAVAISRQQDYWKMGQKRWVERLHDCHPLIWCSLSKKVYSSTWFVSFWLTTLVARTILSEFTKIYHEWVVMYTCLRAMRIVYIQNCCSFSNKIRRLNAIRLYVKFLTLLSTYNLGKINVCCL